MSRRFNDAEKLIKASRLIVLYQRIKVQSYKLIESPVAVTAKLIIICALVKSATECLPSSYNWYIDVEETHYKFFGTT
jgi:hypothetical protein